MRIVLPGVGVGPEMNWVLAVWPPMNNTPMGLAEGVVAGA